MQGGDSGELVAEACKLGVAHPPGYPLFVMLGHIATIIPLPSDWFPNPTPAFRVNFMNAMFGACTAVLMLKCIVLMSELASTNAAPYSRPFAVGMGLIAAVSAW